MAGFSLSQSLASFITYWQNIGITIELPQIKIPDKVKQIIASVRKFVQVILFTVIPSIPKFDVRSQLVILSLGIPFLLDICVMWFINPIITTLLHIVDLGAAFGLGYSASSILFIDNYNQVIVYIICAVSGIWTLIRCIYKLYKSCTKKLLPLTDIVKDICAHYMNKLIPGVEMENTLEQINEQLQSYDNSFSLMARRPPVWRPLLNIFFGLLLITCGVFVAGIFKIPGVVIPATISIFLPYVLYPLGIILTIYGILRLSQCGINAIFKFKNFCKRWGLRLLMFCLDLLYIPILTALVSHMTPTRMSCDPGYSLFVKRHKDDIFDPFVIHDYKCLPCGITFQKVYHRYGQFANYSDEQVAEFTNMYDNFTKDAYISMGPSDPYFNKTCKKLCSGDKLFRLADDHSLRFIDDVVKVNGGTVAFTVLFIMFGIPGLWYSLIANNKKIIVNLYVYGKTTSDKWTNLMSRLNTSGITLFDEFNFYCAFWCVGILLYKFLIMALSTVSTNFFASGVYLLPVIYLAMFIITIYRRPYKSNGNTYVNCLLFLLNFLFACIPIVSQYVKIPQIAITGISIALLILPILSSVFLFLKNATAPVGDDPTKVIEFTEEEQEIRKKRIEKQKRKKAKQRRIKKKKALERKRLERERSKQLSLSRQGTQNSFTNSTYGFDLSSSQVSMISSEAISEEPTLQSSAPSSVPGFPQGYQPGQVPPGYQPGQLPPGFPEGQVPPGYVPGQVPPGFPEGQVPPDEFMELQTERSTSSDSNKVHLDELEDISRDEYLPEDYVEITHREISPINKMVNSKRNNEPFEVNKLVLGERMEMMFTMVDAIIDDTTIKRLTKFLTYAVLFASLSFGWYIASILAPYSNTPAPPCRDYL